MGPIVSHFNMAAPTFKEGFATLKTAGLRFIETDGMVATFVNNADAPVVPVVHVHAALERYLTQCGNVNLNILPFSIKRLNKPYKPSGRQQGYS